MSNLLIYFVPDSVSCRPTNVAELGLAYAFSGSPAVRSRCRGPEGQEGTLLCDPHFDEVRSLFKPDEQTWQKIPGSPCWVGTYRDEPLPPEALARKEQLGGHLVTLADSQQWLVPVARSFVDTEDGLQWIDRLPSTSALDAEGHWVSGPVIDRYRQLWQIAAQWHDARMAAIRNLSAEDEERLEANESVQVILEFENLHTSAVTTLAANYRLSSAEAALLGLLSKQHAIRVLNALTDEPALLEILKKKDPQGQSAG